MLLLLVQLLVLCGGIIQMDTIRWKCVLSRNDLDVGVVWIESSSSCGRPIPKWKILCYLAVKPKSHCLATARLAN